MFGALGATRPRAHVIIRGPITPRTAQYPVRPLVVRSRLLGYPRCRCSANINVGANAFGSTDCLKAQESFGEYHCRAAAPFGRDAIVEIPAGHWRSVRLGVRYTQTVFTLWQP